jgi:ABC-type dipeptide/oligopeptide/nickel transport system permease component
MHTLEYVLKRSGVALLTVFVVVTMNFLMFRVLPGDAITNIAHNTPKLSAAQIAAQEREFGLDRSVGGQYLAYLGQLAHGNLGISYSTRRAVVHDLRVAVVNTIPMVGAATLIAVLLGIATGLLPAWRRGGPLDRGASALALALYALPVPFLGLAAILLFQNYLPVSGMLDPFVVHTSLLSKWADEARHMILPATTLALGLVGQFSVITRTSMLETLGEDYVLTARAKGLSRRRVILRHAFPNALLPIVTLIALSFGFVVGGAILTETLFSWPGVGLEIVHAISERDYPMLQGCFLLLAVSVIACNFFADILYLRLDPRTRA